jgi:hypothetical protein
MSAMQKVDRKTVRPESRHNGISARWLRRQQRVEAGLNHPNKAGIPGWAGAGRFARAYGVTRDGGGIREEIDADQGRCSRAWPENGYPGVPAGARDPKALRQRIATQATSGRMATGHADRVQRRCSTVKNALTGTPKRSAKPAFAANSIPVCLTAIPTPRLANPIRADRPD